MPWGSFKFPEKVQDSYFLSNLAIKPSAHEECWHLVGFPLSFHSFSPSFLGWDNNFVQAKHGGLLIMKIIHWQLYCTFLQRHFLGSVLMSKRDIWGEPLVLGIIQIYKVTASITAFQLCGEMAQVLFLRLSICSTLVGLQQDRIG